MQLQAVQHTFHCRNCSVLVEIRDRGTALAVVGNILDAAHRIPCNKGEKSAAPTNGQFTYFLAEKIVAFVGS